MPGFLSRLFGGGVDASAPVPTPAPPPAALPPISDYAGLFAAAMLERPAEAAQVASRIIAHATDYRAVSAETGAPWWWIGCIHTMECSGRFDQHLHNGDPITARTVHVPAGRPSQGAPPFAWPFSAADALRLRQIVPGRAWTLVDALCHAEAYNGLGYLHRGIRSPYLWASTNLEQPGRYVADGVWDPEAMSNQVGVAAQMLALQAAGVILFDA